MEIHRGIARSMQNFAEVTKNENHSTSRCYVTDLLIDDAYIRIKANNPISIRNGDNVIVAGYKNEDGIVNGYAYKNISNRTTGDRGVWEYFLAGVFMSGFGCIFSLNFKIIPTQISLIIFSIFLSIGFGFTYFSNRIYKAKEAIRDL